MTEANNQSKKRQNDVATAVIKTGSSANLPTGLYLVATPIGNLRDITLRALDVLANADFILAEDTRHSRRLLDRYNLQTPMRSYHEHNADKVTDNILQALQEGKAVALISDAGTPLVSDPGFKLVQAAITADLPVIPIPGASAVLTAISASGLPTDKFLFAGFTPAKSSARIKFLQNLKNTPASLVFFEAPGRVLRSLEDMAKVFNDRPAVLARELTKIHETFIRETITDLIAKLQGQKIRGECVILIGPAQEQLPSLSESQIDAGLLEAISRIGTKAAANEIAQVSGRPMREMYQRALQLKNKDYE
ncbi:MAG: 16S rRNA (cytidine(1402)-2'-O)-methyltransferase [Robiginitomaculum sp.]|nr:16S rRNA (cytidine(1402)-2'-O)-methyltransferase [Robiginitomaculum sp.]